MTKKHKEHEPRKYQRIWKAIETADPDKPVKVLCKQTFQDRLIQAVKKEKSRANVARKIAELPAYGNLRFEKHDDGVQFSIEFNGTML